MDKTNCKLTVYFEDPFWVGVFERTEKGNLSVAKITFGAEPKDTDVLIYISKFYFKLKFSPAVKAVVNGTKKNPKRMHREAKKEMSKNGIGTKSQQALKLQHEENKLIRKTISKKQKEADKIRLFTLKQQKKKEKHKGH